MSEKRHAGWATGPPPFLKNRYRLSEWLGEGGMAVVYRAHDEILDRDVAIKFMVPNRIMGGDLSARFLREARAVARLTHPNIMMLYDVDREDYWHYLVLELIRGRDLHALMVEQGGPLAVPEALHVVRGLLDALTYAHEQGVVHRDVKPENVMITENRQVKVADFGLALAQGDIRLTQEGAVVGTVYYLAPEVLMGVEAGPRADLYAVGAVLYELLTGRPPFADGDQLAIISQILNAPLVPPRQVNLRIPPGLDEIISRLLAKEPERRFGTAAEALAALLAIDGDAVSAGEPGPAEQSTGQLLVERIVRSSSAIWRRSPGMAAPEDGQDEALEPSEELLIFAAIEDTAAAVEAERRRLARLLQGGVADSLNLLMAQINAYEISLGGTPGARMAFSVLTTLIRQSLQQVRDLEARLHPVVLENLGLEPALEALAGQVTREQGLQVTLAVERLSDRLPPQVELALFRMTQDALDRAVRRANASRAAVTLRQEAGQLLFSFTDNGAASAGGQMLRASRQRIEQLGGLAQAGVSAEGHFQLTITFALEPPIDLTPRELEVLQLLAEGLSNKEIGAALTISPRTVNFHLDNVYSKLGVNSRTEAAIFALRRGLIRRMPPDDA